jgi:Fur family ferric uptake transcriptional regulator
MDPEISREARQVFATYLADHGKKRSGQREVILDVFLRSERHLSVDDLLRAVQRRRRDIGRTTVYRTLKLLTEAGLASEQVIEGQTRFERDFKRQHHDHFICRSCGAIFEFSRPEIERIQEEVAAEIGFTIDGHRHQIFGRCRACVVAPARTLTVQSDRG